MLSIGRVGWQRWQAWTEGSLNRRIFSAMCTVGGLTILVKAVAAAKDVFLAYQFGTGDRLEAFLIAFLLPQFAINLVAGSLNAAIIPTYIEVRERHGREAAQRFLSTVAMGSMVFLIVVAGIMAWTAADVLGVLAIGFAPDKLTLTAMLYYLLLPTLLFSGFSTTWGAILNATGRFAIAAAVPVITSLAMVLALLLFGRRWDVYALAIGTAGGMLVEAVILGWALRQAGISIVPYWYGATPAVKQVARQFVPMVAGALLMGSTTLISQAMAAMLPAGSVAALNYGSKLTTLLTGVGTLAVSTAVLPHFSWMVARHDEQGIRHTFLTYTRWILLVTLPLTLALVYFSEPLIRLLFERGAFTEADTALVGRVQALFVLQVPFYTVGMLAVRLISALKANHILMWGAAINLMVNVVLNYLLMQWLGVAGLSLSVTLMYVASMSFLLGMAWRLMAQSRSAGHQSVPVLGA